MRGERIGSEERHRRTYNRLREEAQDPTRQDGRIRQDDKPPRAATGRPTQGQDDDQPLMETASASHNHATTEENHTSGYPTSHALPNPEEAQPETTKFSDRDPIAER
ncbi:hypothetical protein Bca4012_075289 [Brassica carinata]|uniref:Uncharacterized protein n=1 Tax=Brassica carinata TaxID=52824 RepID=A0A8X7QNC6_BRACI|nr:hypothetical protein Bca52824_067862 [Brassica carinata]